MFKYAYKYVVVVSIITMIAIMLLQYTYMMYSRKQADNKFDSAVTIALQNTSLKVLQYNSQAGKSNNYVLPDGAVKRLDKNYYVVNVGDVVDRTVLELFLRDQFRKVNVHLDFEYAIFNCNTNKMEYQGYVNMDTNSDNDRLQTNDFKTYPDFIYYFAVKVNSRDYYLSSEMKMWYLSFGFMFITLIIFSYTIAVIFRQRKFTETQKNFINNITHEFKTPLASIIMSSEVLLSDEIAENRERQKRYSFIIQTQAKKLTAQIDRVLSLMVAENKRLTLKLDEINIYDFVNECLSDAQLLGKNDQVRLVCDSKSMRVMADQTHLGNIVINLVNNAIKYGDESRGVDVSVHKSGATCKIVVRDYGIGIDKKYLKKIFTRFFRVPTGDLHNVKGFGLGLSYVKHFVDLHNWSIDVESKLGKGSAFIVKIPLLL